VKTVPRDLVLPSTVACAQRFYWMARLWVCYVKPEDTLTFEVRLTSVDRISAACCSASVVNLPIPMRSAPSVLWINPGKQEALRGIRLLHPVSRAGCPYLRWQLGRTLATYSLGQKPAVILDTSLGDATKVVWLSLHVRFRVLAVLAYPTFLYISERFRLYLLQSSNSNYWTDGLDQVCPSICTPGRTNLAEWVPIGFFVLNSTKFIRLGFNEGRE